MECEKTGRLKELQNLKSFAENADKEIDAMIKSVGWTVESIENFKPLLECPFNPSHHISEKRLEEHLGHCQWKAEGYGELDVPLSEPSVSPNAPSSIKFDEQLLEEVLQQAKSKNRTLKIGAGNRLIPRTSDRLISDFTSDERKAVYEYVIDKTIKPDVGEDIADLNKPKKESDKSSSYLELLVHERNLKRRRAKHRGVHTNKKSQLEILREVINHQMEMLEEYIAEQNGYEIKEEISTKIKIGANDTCDVTKDDFDEYEANSKDMIKTNNDNVNIEKEQNEYNHYYQYHDHHDRYHNRPHEYHRDYYHEDDNKDSSKNYQDDYEYSKRWHKSSKDDDNRSRKHHHSEERKHHRSHDKSDKYYSRHEKNDDKYDKYDDGHNKHDKKHEHHRSRGRDSSRHSSKTKYESRKSEKKRH